MQMQFPNLEELLAFIDYSFQYRYANSGISSDDTPIGNAPSFIFKPVEKKWKRWRYEDRFYGDKLFAGNIQIFFDSKCVWYMDVQGKCLSDNPEIIKMIYDCLGEALKMAPPAFPFRGPSAFIASNGFRYANLGHGNVKKCYGQESIKNKNDDWLYEVNWRGGIIE